MAITAAMVKELREMTGAGMVDCKNALVETDGNMDAAVDHLRTFKGRKEGWTYCSRRYLYNFSKG